jgi:hypothetical protein
MKLRQEDFGFKAILGYIARPCLKKKKKSITRKSLNYWQMFNFLPVR